MFKIGIIGVRPRQFAMLQGHGFKYIEISCYDAKKMTPESVANFCRDLDRIVLLQTGAPKTAYMGAPKDRLQILRNSSSISSVVRALNTIEAEQAFAHESASTEAERFEHQGEDYSQSITQGTVVEPVVSEPTPPRAVAKESVRLVSEVPNGHVSQYALPKFEDEYVVSLPNSAGEQSYQILLAAMPGDIIRFARPEGLPLEKWQGRIKWARSYYLKHHNMLIEAHYFADFVDLKVMDPSKEEVAVVTDTLNLAPPADVKEAAVTTPTETPRLEIKQELVHDVDKGVHVTIIPDGMSAAEMDFADEDETPAEVQQTTSALDWVIRDDHPPRVNAGAHFTGFNDTLYPAGMTAPVETSPRLKPPVNVESVELTHQQLVEAAERTFMDTTEPAAVVEAPSQEAKTVSTVPERLFWRKVFFHFLNKGMTATHAANQADTALERHRKTL